MPDQQQAVSISEEHGLQAMPDDAVSIYSVGISTAGATEIRMAEQLPGRHIIATTIDQPGAAYATNSIAAAGLADRIQVKLEDVAQPLPYNDGQFDYIYARLVLHYLSKQQLPEALTELKRVLRQGGRLFVVVRSVECVDANRESAKYDSKTGLTKYTLDNRGVVRQEQRFFHTEASISRYVTGAGFKIEHVDSYDEQLFKGFMRDDRSPHYDSLIELLAVKS